MKGPGEKRVKFISISFPFSLPSGVLSVYFLTTKTVLIRMN
jgi:hypothetical protein